MAKAAPEEQIFEKSPYIQAAKALTARDAATLAQLIEDGLDVNYAGRETNTPWGRDTVTLLLWAELQENIAGMEMLLKAGADPDMPTQRGLTPLIDASMRERDDIFELLLVNYGANPNKIFDRDSALTFVLMERELGERRWRRAEMLLQYGADIDLDLDRGKTAVIALTARNAFREVLWLLEHGANFEVRNRFEFSMMRYLRSSYESPLLPEIHNDRDAVRDWLLAHGVAHSRVGPPLQSDGEHAN